MAADQFAVPASEDPLACLDSVLVAPAGHQALLPALPPPLPSGACASQQPEEHVLLLTDDTRALLRVLAPWLASGQPILLVRVGVSVCVCFVHSSTSLPAHACVRLGGRSNRPSGWVLLGGTAADISLGYRHNVCPPNTEA